MATKYKIFKTEDAITKAFFKIKDIIMKDYGIKDIDDEYDEMEDEIMGETHRRFEEKYGWEYYDAIDDLEERDKNSIKC